MTATVYVTAPPTSHMTAAVGRYCTYVIAVRGKRNDEPAATAAMIKQTSRAMPCHNDNRNQCPMPSHKVITLNGNAQYQYTSRSFSNLTVWASLNLSISMTLEEMPLLCPAKQLPSTFVLTWELRQEVLQQRFKISRDQVLGEGHATRIVAAQGKLRHLWQLEVLDTG